MLTMTAAVMKVLVAFSLANTPTATPTAAATSRDSTPAASRVAVQDWAGAYTIEAVEPEKVGPLVLHLLVERGSQGLLAVVIEDDGTSALSNVQADAQHFSGTMKTTQGDAHFDLHADGDRIAGTLTLAGHVLRLEGNRIN